MRRSRACPASDPREELTGAASPQPPTRAAVQPLCKPKRPEQLVTHLSSASPWLQPQAPNAPAAGARRGKRILTAPGSLSPCAGTPARGTAMLRGIQQQHGHGPVCPGQGNSDAEGGSNSNTAMAPCAGTPARGRAQRCQQQHRHGPVCQDSCPGQDSAMLRGVQKQHRHGPVCPRDRRFPRGTSPGRPLPPGAAPAPAPLLPPAAGRSWPGTSRAARPPSALPTSRRLAPAAP